MPAVRRGWLGEELMQELAFPNTVDPAPQVFLSFPSELMQAEKKRPNAVAIS